MQTKVSTLFVAVARWMDGSLFFRGLTAILNFIKNICADSFFARAFIADSAPLDDSVKRSFFANITDKVLNGLPRPITAPEYWNRNLSKLFAGSWLINTFCEHAGAPIPKPSETAGLELRAIFQWLLFALPAFGIIAVAFATPFLPTMMLAGLLLVILFFTLLSRKFVIDGMTVFLLIFILISMIAAVTSIVPRSSIQIALLTSVFMMSVLAIVACCNSQKTVDLMIKVFVISAAFTGLVGLWQRVAGLDIGIWLDQTAFAGEGRIVSTFGNPNVYGTYLLLAIPLAAACIVYVKGVFPKLCAIGITGLLIINLFLTLSRGCYLSLALAVGIFVLIIEKRLIIPLIPVVAALPFILPRAIIARFMSIFNMADTSTAFRLNIWRGSLRMLQDFWLSGIGQGIDAYDRVYPFYSLAAIHSPHSHSLYIQYLVEIGVIGFAVFVIVLACYFRTMANFLRRTTEFRLRIMTAAMIAAVIGFLFQGVTDFVFYNYRVLLAFYMFIGIGIAFTRVYAPPPAPKIQEPSLVSNYHEHD